MTCTMIINLIPPVNKNKGGMKFHLNERKFNPQALQIAVEGVRVCSCPLKERSLNLLDGGCKIIINITLIYNNFIFSFIFFN